MPSLDLCFKDGTKTKLELEVATQLKIGKEMINIDRAKKGGWRMIWSTSLIPDITQLEKIEINREDIEL